MQDTTTPQEDTTMDAYTEFKATEQQLQVGDHFQKLAHQDKRWYEVEYISKRGSSRRQRPLDGGDSYRIAPSRYAPVLVRRPLNAATPMPSATPAPAPAEPQHHVVAVLADGHTRVRCTGPLAWAAAQDAWLALDNERVAGRMPHVRFYAVRSTDDPQWQGLKLSQLAVCPVAPRGSERPKQRPTRAQAQQLARLERLSRADYDDGWVRGTRVGSPTMLYHLHLKGYLDQRMEHGPRGGERPLYRPTLAGYDFLARRVALDTGATTRRAA